MNENEILFTYIKSTISAAICSGICSSENKKLSSEKLNSLANKYADRVLEDFLKIKGKG